MRKQHITLRQADKSFLEKLLKKGSLKAITYQRATALLELNSGKTIYQVSQFALLIFRQFRTAA